MKIINTPEERFKDLPGFPFSPNFNEVEPDLKMHYVDEGPRDGAVVLLLHGQPSWSYLYRKMIPVFAAAGFRTIAPDLIGFGRSSKPTEQTDYSYALHINWLYIFLQNLGLQDIHLFCQDWGGLTGLRLVTADPGRFKTVTAANTALPTGDQTMPEAFTQWQEFVKSVPFLQVGKIIQAATESELSAAEMAAYDAPFPDAAYQAGAKIFPSLVPTSPDDPESQNNRNAWQALMQFDKPFLTLFSDKDPIMLGAEKIFQKLVPGAKHDSHTIIKDGGHFLQEDKGEEVARKMIDFIN